MGTKSIKAFVVTSVVVIAVIAIDKMFGLSDKALGVVGKKAA